MTPKGYRKGQFTPDDLDIAILRALPASGSKIGKYLDDGIPISALPGLVDAALPSSTYAGRVKSMEFAGLIVKTKGPRGDQVRYQRTTEGDALAKPQLRRAAAGGDE